MLIDCGEGTQTQLSRYKCKSLRINHIFISHLHGDHYLGLMGLLFTMHLLRRTTPLNIYGPKGLDQIITTQLKYSDSALNYQINFHTLSGQRELLLDTNLLTVHSFPIYHRIPCVGFVIKEKTKPRRIIKETIPDDIKLEELANLKKGKDVLDREGKVKYANSKYTRPPRKSRSYAYCSDTKYDERIIEHIKGVDLLYHEATFLKEKELWAAETFHTTTAQAGKIASKANVGELLIGHFSARYKDLTVFLNETKTEFERTRLAIEGETISIPD